MRVLGLQAAAAAKAHRAAFVAVAVVPFPAEQVPVHLLHVP